MKNSSFLGLRIIEVYNFYRVKHVIVECIPNGEDIILNCDLKLITWRQSLKRYDAEESSRDYQIMRSAGLEDMYMSLPVLQ